ncbi:MAG: hypothetical protein WC139_10235 [Candidatus Kapaibacterium sp.]
MLLSLGLFSSCNEDNPITSKSYFAPQRYSWKVDTLEGLGYEMEPFDSNSYYILKYSNSLIKNDNGIITQYALDFSCQRIEGDEENHLMLGGNLEISNGFMFPILKYFNNGSLTEVYKDTVSSFYHYFRNIKFIDNVYWCGTSKGKVVSYDNGIINTFAFDSSFAVMFISKDRNNTLNVVLQRTEKDSLGFPVYTRFNVFSYISGAWQLVYQKLTTNESLIFYPGVKNRILALTNVAGPFGTYDFANGSFIKVFDENITGVICTSVGGDSMNDLIILGRGINSNNMYSSLFHWNGFALSEEIINDFNIAENILGKITYGYGKYYVYCENESNGMNYLIIGTKLK